MNSAYVCWAHFGTLWSSIRKCFWVLRHITHGCYFFSITGPDSGFDWRVLKMYLSCPLLVPFGVLTQLSRKKLIRVPKGLNESCRFQPIPLGSWRCLGCGAEVFILLAVTLATVFYFFFLSHWARHCRILCIKETLSMCYSFLHVLRQQMLLKALGIRTK